MPPAPHSPDPGRPALAASVYAEVAVNAGRPLRQPFTYAVPADFLTRTGPLRVGHGVFVPFGRKVVQGVVLALRNDTDIASPRGLEARIDPADPTPLLTPAQAALARWIADAYLASLWSCVSLFLPRRMTTAPLRILSAGDPAPPSDDDPLSDLQAALLADVRARGPHRRRAARRPPRRRLDRRRAGGARASRPRR